MKVILTKPLNMHGSIKPKGTVLMVDRQKRNELVQTGWAKDWPEVSKPIKKEK